MNRALYYFGGKKSLMIPFIIFLGLYSIATLRQAFFINEYSLFSFLGELLFLAVLYGMWLRVSKNILVFGVCISAALRIAYFLYESRYIGGDYAFLCNLIYLIPNVTVIILLTYQKKKSPAMKETFLVLDVLTFLSQFIPIILIYHDTMPSDVIYSLILNGWMTFDVIYGVIMAGVMTFLWIPLEMFRICPSCGFRNEKTAGFCGGCGSRL